MLIPMLTAVLSTIWGLGLMGHSGLMMDTWNVSTPVLLIAVAAGHSAQMLKRYIEEVGRLGDNHAAVISSMVAMGPVMIAAGGVAALGFAALTLTGIPAIINFGLACAYGIASVVVLEMTFVPALRSLGFGIPVTPDGGFFVYADCSKFCSDSERFCRDVLESAGVAITPGVDFGRHRAHEHVRFAYTIGQEKIEEGIARLAGLLAASHRSDIDEKIQA